MATILAFLTIGSQLLATQAVFDICAEAILSDASGSVSSPNYPSDYGNNLNCSVSITTTSDKVLSVTFDAFAMESHATCSNDFLSVYDGTTLYTSKSFCGTHLPRSFVSHNSQVTLTFRSNPTTTASGFLISWTAIDRCADTEFTCWDGVCIPASQHCDGTKQCADDSDEIECAQTASSNSECGKLAVAPSFLWDNRIVGGQNARAGYWPWQVRLTITVGGGKYYCGGSIVSDMWIATAAHCTYGATAVLVKAGIIDVSDTSDIQEIKVSQSGIINHPDYNSSLALNDIALLHLDTAISFSTTVRPVCIPTDTAQFDIPAGTVCIASGFGALGFENSLSSTLQQVRLPIVDQTSCQSAYPHLVSSNICAGNWAKGGVDTCQGDSGGPLVCFVNESTWYLVGITSYGLECARANKPGVYSRVSKFNTWINEKMSTSRTTVVYDICTASTITAATGSITTPNYPSNYAINLDCTVDITTTSDKVLAMRFNDFDLEYHDTCAFDSLRVYDGTTLYASRAFCGTYSPRNFTSHNSLVKLHFVSDFGTTAKGFSISWTAQDRCADTEFTCWDGVCIPASQQCDGTKQCADDSDEIECVQSATSHDVCGKVATAPSFLWDHRIVGGQNAQAGAWPWQVRLSVTVGGSNYLCGGSIISSEWVATAAHCTHGATGVTVRAGIIYTSQVSGVQQITVAQSGIFNHQDYVSTSNDDDIALLHLDTPLTFSENVRPVCIPTDTTEFDIPTGTICVATGFGALAYDNSVSTYLQQVRLPIFGQTSCQNVYSQLTSSNICAGHEKGGVDTCQGDSGGPLVCLINERTWYLIGITSYGYQCARPNSPGVYARVSKYNTWITQTLEANGGTLPTTTTTTTGPTTTTTATTTTTTTVTTTTTTPAPTCGETTLTSASGVVQSPGYPGNYPPSIACVWSITTNVNKVITITFVAIDLEAHDSCSYDYIKVYDGNELYTGQAFCGTQKPKTFAAVSTTVRIEFSSDSSSLGTGFEIQWDTIDRCSATEFTCWNGTCIPTSNHCDGVRHCLADDSDEIECEQRPTSNDQCGKVYSPPTFTWDNRIVGGNEAAVNSWPWQVSISSTLGGNPSCGGTIIGNEWILSAAHCLKSSVASETLISAGRNSLNDVAPQTSIAQEIRIHESFTSVELGFDIALVRLATPLVFNEQVRPICLPTSASQVEGIAFGVATGWGSLKQSGPTPTKLHQVRLPILTENECASALPSATILSSQVCAGDVTNGGIDTCLGDSGGPLAVLVSESSWTQVGITSYGYGCAAVGAPGISTRVSSFVGWINGVMSEPLTTTTVSTVGNTSTRPQGFVLFSVFLSLLISFVHL